MSRQDKTKLISDRREAYSDAYRCNKNHLYAAALSILKDPYLAEDAVHEAFEAVLKQDALPDDPKEAKALLTVVTRRRALNALKKQIHTADSEPDEYQLGYTAPYEGSELAMVIDSMPAIYKEVILLHYGMGFSAVEISKLLNVSYNAVLKRLERARTLLREEWGKS